MTRRGDYLSPDKYLTIEEVKRLRDSVRAEANQAKKNGSRRGIVNWMLIELMLETRLRAEEVCSLTSRQSCPMGNILKGEPFE
jgi:integrase